MTNTIYIQPDFLQQMRVNSLLAPTKKKPESLMTSCFYHTLHKHTFKQQTYFCSSCPPTQTVMLLIVIAVVSWDFPIKIFEVRN
ncbi:CLUMA_CG019862, isoform A [Clunio marinus]|uniref:CLUMA_CG019862, isoform A n=1 Tax=Clunio marinus TaxID=568069 RepID=A0A1J1J7A4_9DIPT|nr:CLUMA_CG019862, isoform A [Clunio marinus]